MLFRWIYGHLVSAASLRDCWPALQGRDGREHAPVGNSETGKRWGHPKECSHCYGESRYAAGSCTLLKLLYEHSSILVPITIPCRLLHQGHVLPIDSEDLCSQMPGCLSCSPLLQPDPSLPQAHRRPLPLKAQARSASPTEPLQTSHRLPFCQPKS